MCGLYGYTTKSGVKLGKKQREQRGRILSGLAVAMQERGTHSTGVAGVCKEHGWCLVKQALSASEFINTQDYKDFVEHSPRVVIGHTRYATVGAVNNDNAHPFHEGNIIGTHNGSVYNHKEVMPEAEVDSQAIFHALDQYDNDFAPALKELRGKFAITWFDQRTPDKLHIVLDGNPLSIVRIPELQTYFWASTKYALEAVLSSHFDMRKNTIWTPHTEMVYTIDDRHQIERAKVEFGQYVAPATPDYSGYESKYKGWNGNTHKFDWEKELDKKELDEEEKELREYGQFLLKDGKDNDNFTKVMDLDIEDMRLIMARCGECEFCTKPIDIDNEGMYWNERERMILCWKCGDDLEDWNNYVWLEQEDLYDIDNELFMVDEAEKEEGDNCAIIR